MVLLKAFDERGLVFFTHYTSRKGRELDANPRAALLLHWDPLGRQVRIEGAVERVLGGGVGRVLRDAAAGCAGRRRRVTAERGAREPRRARARASRSSSRPTDVARPETWGGFRLAPGGVGVLAAPRRPPARPLSLPPRRRRLGHRAALPLAAPAPSFASRSSQRRRPRPSRRRRRRAAPASPRSASRGPRGSRAGGPASASATSCFATACRVTGSSAASSVAVALPRAATASTSERRPGSPSASKTPSTRPEPRERVQLERRAPLGRGLDDVQPRAAVDLLELEDDLAVVVPVEDEPLAGLDASRTTARRSSPSLPAEDARAARAARRARPRSRTTPRAARAPSAPPRPPRARRGRRSPARSASLASSHLTRNRLVAYKCAT